MKYFEKSRYIYCNERDFERQFVGVQEAQSLAIKYKVAGLEQIIDGFLNWYCLKNEYLEIYSNYKEAGDEKRAQFWMKVNNIFFMFLFNNKLFLQVQN